MSLNRSDLDRSGHAGNRSVLEAVASDTSVADELLNRLTAEEERHEIEVERLKQEKQALARYLASVYNTSSASTNILGGIHTASDNVIAPPRRVDLPSTSRAVLRTAVDLDNRSSSAIRSRDHHPGGAAVGSGAAPLQIQQRHDSRLQSSIVPTSETGGQNRAPSALRARDDNAGHGGPGHVRSPMPTPAVALLGSPSRLADSIGPKYPSTAARTSDLPEPSHQRHLHDGGGSGGHLHASRQPPRAPHAASEPASLHSTPLRQRGGIGGIHVDSLLLAGKQQRVDGPVGRLVQQEIDASHSQQQRVNRAPSVSSSTSSSIIGPSRAAWPEAQQGNNNQSFGSIALASPSSTPLRPSGSERVTDYGQRTGRSTISTAGSIIADAAAANSNVAVTMPAVTISAPDVDRAVSDVWSVLQLRQDAMLATLGERLSIGLRDAVQASVQQLVSSELHAVIGGAVAAAIESQKQNMSRTQLEAEAKHHAESANQRSHEQQQQQSRLQEGMLNDLVQRVSELTLSVSALSDRTDASLRIAGSCCTAEHLNLGLQKMQQHVIEDQQRMKSEVLATQKQTIAALEMLRRKQLAVNEEIGEAVSTIAAAVAQLEARNGALESRIEGIETAVAANAGTLLEQQQSHAARVELHFASHGSDKMSQLDARLAHLEECVNAAAQKSQEAILQSVRDSQLEYASMLTGALHTKLDALRSAVEVMQPSLDALSAAQAENSRQLEASLASEFRSMRQQLDKATADASQAVIATMDGSLNSKIESLAASVEEKLVRNCNDLRDLREVIDAKAAADSEASKSLAAGIESLDVKGLHPLRQQLHSVSEALAALQGSFSSHLTQHTAAQADVLEQMKHSVEQRIDEKCAQTNATVDDTGKQAVAAITTAAESLQSTLMLQLFQINGAVGASSAAAANNEARLQGLVTGFAALQSTTDASNRGQEAMVSMMMPIMSQFSSQLNSISDGVSKAAKAHSQVLESVESLVSSQSGEAAELREQLLLETASSVQRIEAALAQHIKTDCAARATATTESSAGLQQLQQHVSALEAAQTATLAALKQDLGAQRESFGLLLKDNVTSAIVAASGAHASAAAVTSEAISSIAGEIHTVKSSLDSLQSNVVALQPGMSTLLSQHSAVEAERQSLELASVSSAIAVVLEACNAVKKRTADGFAAVNTRLDASSDRHESDSAAIAQNLESVASKLEQSLSTMRDVETWSDAKLSAIAATVSESLAVTHSLSESVGGLLSSFSGDIEASQQASAQQLLESLTKLMHESSDRDIAAVRAEIASIHASQRDHTSTIQSSLAILASDLAPKLQALLEQQPLSSAELAAATAAMKAHHASSIEASVAENVQALTHSDERQVAAMDARLDTMAQQIQDVSAAAASASTAVLDAINRSCRDAATRNAAVADDAAARLLSTETCLSSLSSAIADLIRSEENNDLKRGSSSADAVHALGQQMTAALLGRIDALETKQEDSVGLHALALERVQQQLATLSSATASLEGGVTRISGLSETFGPSVESAMLLLQGLEQSIASLRNDVLAMSDNVASTAAADATPAASLTEMRDALANMELSLQTGITDAVESLRCSSDAALARGMAQLADSITELIGKKLEGLQSALAAAPPASNADVRSTIVEEVEKLRGDMIAKLTEQFSAVTASNASFHERMETTTSALSRELATLHTADGDARIVLSAESIAVLEETLTSAVAASVSGVQLQLAGAVEAISTLHDTVSKHHASVDASSAARALTATSTTAAIEQLAQTQDRQFNEMSNALETLAIRGSAEERDEGIQKRQQLARIADGQREALAALSKQPDVAQLLSTLEGALTALIHSESDRTGNNVVQQLVTSQGAVVDAISQARQASEHQLTKILALYSSTGDKLTDVAADVRKVVESEAATTSALEGIVRVCDGNAATLVSLVAASAAARESASSASSLVEASLAAIAASHSAAAESMSKQLHDARHQHAAGFDDLAEKVLDRLGIGSSETLREVVQDLLGGVPAAVADAVLSRIPPPPQLTVEAVASAVMRDIKEAASGQVADFNSQLEAVMRVEGNLTAAVHSSASALEARHSASLAQNLQPILDALSQLQLSVATATSGMRQSNDVLALLQDLPTRIDEVAPIIHDAVNLSKHSAKSVKDLAGNVSSANESTALSLAALTCAIADVQTTTHSNAADVSKVAEFIHSNPPDELSLVRSAVQSLTSTMTASLSASSERSVEAAADGAAARVEAGVVLSMAALATRLTSQLDARSTSVISGVQQAVQALLTDPSLQPSHAAMLQALQAAIASMQSSIAELSSQQLGFTPTACADLKALKELVADLSARVPSIPPQPLPVPASHALVLHPSAPAAPEVEVPSAVQSRRSSIGQAPVQHDVLSAGDTISTFAPAHGLERSQLATNAVHDGVASAAADEAPFPPQHKGATITDLSRVDSSDAPSRHSHFHSHARTHGGIRVGLNASTLLVSRGPGGHIDAEVLRGSGIGIGDASTYSHHLETDLAAGGIPSGASAAAASAVGRTSRLRRC